MRSIYYFKQYYNRFKLFDLNDFEDLTAKNFYLY